MAQDFTYYNEAMNFYNMMRRTSVRYGQRSSFDINSLLALRRGTDLVRRYYFQLTLSQPRALGQGGYWTGWTDTNIRGFCGSPAPTTGSTPLRKSERAFAFEYDPVNPSESSPWHNLIYEIFINPFNAGMRAISIHFPFGYPYIYDGLTAGAYAGTPLDWLYGSHATGPFTSLTDAERSPARVKGFTGAVNKLLNGTLKPTNGSRTSENGVNEPCDVLLYLPSYMGDGVYRSHTIYYWDGLTGTSAERDIKLTQRLDQYVDFITSMKANIENDGISYGILSVCFDVGALSASPTTVQLYRSLPGKTYGYRSDICELADHYVERKLKQSNIPTARESRPFGSLRKAYSKSVFDNIEINGELGETAETGFQNFSSDENWLWYSNPDLNSAFDGNNTRSITYVRNVDNKWIHRINGSYTTYHGYVPYGVTYIISYGGKTADIGFLSNDAELVSGVYNPYHHLSHIYSGADLYMDYLYRSTGLEGWANRRLLDNFSIISLYAPIYLGCGLFFTTGSTQYTWFYNSRPFNSALYPLFNTSAPKGWTFTIPIQQLSPSGYSGYTGGFWTTTSRDWYRHNILGGTYPPNNTTNGDSGVTFGYLLNIFKDLAMNHNPPGKSNPPGYESSPGFTYWGNDVYYLNILDPIVRQ